MKIAAVAAMTRNQSNLIDLIQLKISNNNNKLHNYYLNNHNRNRNLLYLNRIKGVNKNNKLKITQH